MNREEDMSYEEMTSDHAFTAFLAGVRPKRMYDDELAMYRYFEKHPGQLVMRAVESAIQAYEKGRK
ncbi:hypothetical protein J2X63_003203 [Agromyces sp. 3263]|uniref:hypothetical protein n=1 Tax=Agromyces sp. 3263 TaxID=2817750 RepID=UPI002862A5A8|nr:hypothetical protein [Agromyces sp. 3263]MDR6907495.1 hypothetical protein [Agromyces sp. 3263]